MKIDQQRLKKQNKKKTVSRHEVKIKGVVNNKNTQLF